MQRIVWLVSLVLAATANATTVRHVIASQDSLEDFYVNSGATTTNYGSTVSAFIGTGTPIATTSVRYGIRPTLPAVTANSILSCSLFVFCRTEGGDATKVYAAPITEQWNLSEATWANRITGTAWAAAGITAGARFDSVTVAQNADTQYYGWRVTQPIIDQLNGNAFGVRLSTPELATYERDTWIAEDHTTTAWRPYFVLNYLLPGTTDYTQDANCLGAWFMNGASAGLEYDRTGSGNTLYAVCSNENLRRSTAVPAGYTGASRWFGCVGDGYLVRPDATSLNVNGANAKLSIAAWVYVTTVPGSGTQTTVVSKYMTGSNHRQYRLQINGTGSSQFKFTATLSSDGTAMQDIHSTATTYAANTWYHVVLVYDDVDLRLYVNGELASTPVAYTAGIASKSGRFSIGSQYSGLGLLCGNVDEVAVFDRALYAAEVSDIHANGLTGNRGASDYPLYTALVNSDGAAPHDSLLYTFVRDSTLALCALNPSWQYVVWGTSPQGRELFGVRIAPAGYTSTIVVDAAIHGNNREGTTSYGAVEFLRWLSANPFPRIRWIFLMQTNPDGVKLSQRKNSREVNVNRNFSFGWDTLSFAPTHSEYQGPSPFSEPEAQVLCSLVWNHNPRMWLNVHTNSNQLFVFNSSYVAGAKLANDSLERNGLEPYVKVTASALYYGAGYAFSWGTGVANVARAYGYEFGVCSTAPLLAEETERLIAFMNYYAQHISFIPAVTSVSAMECSLTVINWSLAAQTDSLDVLRVSGATTTHLKRLPATQGSYVDTLHAAGNYGYRLIARTNAGAVSDTSDTYSYYLVTLPCPTPAENIIIRRVIASSDSLKDFGAYVAAPATNYSDDATQLIGTGDSETDVVWRYGIWATLPGISAAQIVACSLHVYCLTDAGSSTATFYTAPIIEPWDITRTSWIMRQAGVTWTEMGITAGSRTDSVTVAANADSQYYRWDVTQIVKSQLVGTAFGVRVSAAEQVPYEAKLWATVNNASPAVRPYFVLYYMESAGGRGAYGRTGMRTGFGRYDER